MTPQQATDIRRVLRVLAVSATHAVHDLPEVLLPADRLDTAAAARLRLPRVLPPFWHVRAVKISGDTLNGMEPLL
jgi:hypothetical protein